jgi:hypothetical protein
MPRKKPAVSTQHEQVADGSAVPKKPRGKRSVTAAPSTQVSETLLSPVPPGVASGDGAASVELVPERRAELDVDVDQWLGLVPAQLPEREDQKDDDVVSLATPEQTTAEQPKRKQPAAETLNDRGTDSLSSETLADLCVHNPASPSVITTTSSRARLTLAQGKIGAAALEGTVRPSAGHKQLNDYVVPGILQYRAGTISQFLPSPGLPPIAGDSCETFSTVSALCIASMRRYRRLKRVFNTPAVNWLVYSCAWLHQITWPVWNRNGTQSRPRVSDVAECCGLGDAFSNVSIDSKHFLAVAYRNRSYASRLLQLAVDESSSLAAHFPNAPEVANRAVRGFVVVAGGYAFGIASLEYRVRGRLLAWSLVLCDSHGELAWSQRQGCLSCVRFRANDYETKGRKYFESFGDHDGARHVISVVDSLPPFEDGFGHFSRIAFALFEDCRRDHGPTSPALQKYMTWVPILEAPDSDDLSVEAQLDIKTGISAQRAVDAIDNATHRILQDPSSMQYLRRAASVSLSRYHGDTVSIENTEAMAESTRRFFTRSAAGEIIAPLRCWVSHMHDSDDDDDEDSGPVPATLRLPDTVANPIPSPAAQPAPELHVPPEVSPPQAQPVPPTKPTTKRKVVQRNLSPFPAPGNVATVSLSDRAVPKPSIVAQFPSAKHQHAANASADSRAAAAPNGLVNSDPAPGVAIAGSTPLPIAGSSALPIAGSSPLPIAGSSPLSAPRERTPPAAPLVPPPSRHLFGTSPTPRSSLAALMSLTPSKSQAANLPKPVQKGAPGGKSASGARSGKSSAAGAGAASGSGTILAALSRVKSRQALAGTPPGGPSP